MNIIRIIIYCILLLIICFLTYQMKTVVEVLAEYVGVFLKPMHILPQGARKGFQDGFMYISGSKVSHNQDLRILKGLICKPRLQPGVEQVI